jgi:aryl-alcohol dehydrogenase-like predicted oxidoreductase
MTRMTNETSTFLHTIEMGLGSSAWGDRVIWQYGLGFSDSDLSLAFQAALNEGISFIDTAEVYGSGRSERLIGRFARQSDRPILVATKFFPWPWRLAPGAVMSALRGSLARLGMDSVALYQLHRPTPFHRPERIMEAMLPCLEAGLTRAVGVSNFSESEMLRAYSTLARHDRSLASNQVHFSLLSRHVEKNGLLARCKELGIRLIAYSPLEMGLLTGKYGPQNPPPGSRGVRYTFLISRIGPMLKLMTKIGQDHGGKSNAQVALNWVICKGALPIPGAKTQAQAQQNTAAMGWRLSQAEIAALDQASDAIA